jgi:hypothetical protein
MQPTTQTLHPTGRPHIPPAVTRPIVYGLIVGIPVLFIRDGILDMVALAVGVENYFVARMLLGVVWLCFSVVGALWCRARFCEEIRAELEAEYRAKLAAAEQRGWNDCHAAITTRVNEITNGY